MSPSPRPFYHSPLLPLLAVVIVAVAVRFVALDAPALWWDEGNNAFFAKAGPGGVFEWSKAAREADPPVHRILLGFWLQLFGDSVYALRSLSALFGVGLVVLMFHWGRWLAGLKVGLIAGLLTALAPVLVYYSREAKSYPMVAFFALLALYIWARRLDGTDPRSRWWWAAYVLAAAVAIGCHYYAVVLFAGHGLFLLGRALVHRGSLSSRLGAVWPAFAADAVAVALVSPWLILTSGTTTAGVASAAGLSVSRSVLDFLQSLAFGLTAGVTAPWRVGALSLAAFLLLTVVGVRRVGLQKVLLPIALVLCAAACAYIVQSAVAFFEPRFLLSLAPLLCLLAALGLARRSWSSAVGLALLVGSWSAALPFAYQPFASAYDDFRPVASTIGAMGQDADVVVAGYIWQIGMLKLYAPGERDYEVGWYSQDQVGDTMLTLFEKHPRLWLATFNVPNLKDANSGGAWLEQYATRISTVESGNNRAVLYLSPQVLPR